MVFDAFAYSTYSIRYFSQTDVFAMQYVLYNAVKHQYLHKRAHLIVKIARVAKRQNHAHAQEV